MNDLEKEIAATLLQEIKHTSCPAPSDCDDRKMWAIQRYISFLKAVELRVAVECMGKQLAF